MLHRHGRSRGITCSSSVATYDISRLYAVDCPPSCSERLGFFKLRLAADAHHVNPAIRQ